ncbi:MAG: hypothetical protein ABIH20_05225 [Candidatus Diapherotrites archaeon]
MVRRNVKHKKKRRDNERMQPQRSVLIPFGSFERVASRMKRAIPQQTYLHRINNWGNIKRKELGFGDARESSERINEKIELIKRSHESGRLTENSLHKHAFGLEQLACRLTDEVLLVNHGKLKRADREKTLEQMFSAEEWNAAYLKYMGELWHLMPAPLQQIMIERLMEK